MAHGDDAHSFTLVAQVVPAYPGRQAHVYAFTPSVHVPPFTHGEDAHSLMFVAHVAPL